VKTAFATLWRGAAAKRALAAARADLAAGPLEPAVTRRLARPTAATRRPLALRAFARALAARLRREGDESPCLPRALALLEEARACGFAPSLVLGVRRGTSAPIASHAWLSLGGVPFLEDPETPTRYAVIAVLPRTGQDDAEA
jgi:hypothetical protein